MISSSSLVLALALCLIVVVSPALAISAAERAAAPACGTPATIPAIPSSGLNARYRGAVFYPGETSFSSVKWFPFTPNCNVTAGTPAPTPASTSIAGYSLRVNSFATSDTNPNFRGVGSEAFLLTSFFGILPIAHYGDISLKIGNGTEGHNNGNPPEMINLVTNSINNATIQYALLSMPVIQFKNGVVVGLSLNVIYPKLPDNYAQLNSRLAETFYDQYYTLVVEGNMWIITEYATGNVRASGFFDSVPCSNILPGVPNPTVCNGIPN